MRREFFETVKGLVSKGLENKRLLSVRAGEIKAKIESGRYSPQVVAELRDELRAIEREIESVDINARHEADLLIEQFKRALAAEVALCGADIDDADAKLLQFDLTEKEYLSLLDKHQSNPTMTQLVLKNAKSRGLDLGVHFTGNDSEIQSADGVRDAVRVALDHYQIPSVYDRLFGDGSAFERAYDVEDRNWKDNPVVAYSSDRLANAVALLSGGNDISEDVQRDVVREFTGQRGALEILRGAAKRGRNFIAADEAANLMEANA